MWPGTHAGGREAGQNLAQGLEVPSQKRERTDQGFRQSRFIFLFHRGLKLGCKIHKKEVFKMPLPRFRTQVIVPKISSRQQNSLTVKAGGTKGSINLERDLRALYCTAATLSGLNIRQLQTLTMAKS